jgi:hypothetical protein
MDASSGPHGDLKAYVQREDGLYVHQGLAGEISRFTAAAAKDARSGFTTALHALHLDYDGARKHAELIERGASHAEAQALIPQDNIKGAHHLGSGTITYGGMQMLANDPTWIGAATPFCTLSSMLYVASGTGATAMAATDYGIQTLVTNGQITGGTFGYTTGVITNGGNGATNTWKNACTVAYNAGLNILEYGLFMANTPTAVIGTAQSTTATSLTTAASVFLNSGNFHKGWICEANASLINTPTTTATGLVTSNNATVLTFANGWNTLANASASTPSGTTGFVLYPAMLDHKTFGVITVIAGDSIVYSYSLSCAVGG